MFAIIWKLYLRILFGCSTNIWFRSQLDLVEKVSYLKTQKKQIEEAIDHYSCSLRRRQSRPQHHYRYSTKTRRANNMYHKPKASYSSLHSHSSSSAMRPSEIQETHIGLHTSPSNTEYLPTNGVSQYIEQELSLVTKQQYIGAIQITLKEKHYRLYKFF